MSRRLTFWMLAATMALIFSVAVVAALLWGKRAVVWQVYRSEREVWRHRLTAWVPPQVGP